MIKKYKNYIILAVLIVVLIAAYFIIMGIDVDKENETKDDYISILEVDKKDVKEIEIKNEEGSYTFSFTDKIRLKNADKNIILDTEKVEYLLSEACYLNSDSIISDKKEDIKKYGIDKAPVTLRITDKNNKVYEAVLGDKTAVNEGRYVKISNDDNIYILPEYKCQVLERNLGYYRKTNKIEIKKENIKEVAFEVTGKQSVSFKRKGQNVNPDVPNNVFAQYEMVAPYQWDAEGEKVSNIVQSVTDSSVIDYVSDDGNGLENYGFNPYYAKITITENDGKKTELKLGNNIDGKFYAMYGNEKSLYTISNSAFSYLSNAPFSFLQSLAYLRNVDTVDKISYNHIGKIKTEFSITKKGEETDVKKDGKNVSRDIFSKMYMELMSIPLGGPLDDARDKTLENLVLTYDFYFKDGKVDHVGYYDYDERRLILVINDKMQFYVNKSEFNNRIDKVDDFIINKL